MSGCTHGMPTPAACVDCMDEGPVAPPRRNTVPAREGWPIGAAFAGHCAGCNLPINVGDRIVRVSNNTWQHARCAP